jgi:hypothetical protein
MPMFHGFCCHSATRSHVLVAIAEQAALGAVQHVMGYKTWVLGAAIALGMVGCAGSEPQANTPSCPPGQLFDGHYCQMASSTPPAGTAGTGSGGGGVTPTPNPTPSPAPSLGLAVASCPASIAPIDVSAAQPITAALLPLAAQKAMPGAKPVGTLVAAQFQQGQCLKTTITMSPGKCYSIVGTALPTVQNLDVSLVPSFSLPGVQPTVVASDNSVAPNAVVGEAPNCFKWALPMAGTMDLIVSVPAGQGLAGVQVFEK